MVPRGSSGTPHLELEAGRVALEMAIPLYMYINQPGLAVRHLLIEQNPKLLSALGAMVIVHDILNAIKK